MGLTNLGLGGECSSKSWSACPWEIPLLFWVWPLVSCSLAYAVPQQLSVANYQATTQMDAAPSPLERHQLPAPGRVLKTAEVTLYSLQKIFILVIGYIFMFLVFYRFLFFLISILSFKWWLTNLWSCLRSEQCFVFMLKKRFESARVQFPNCMSFTFITLFVLSFKRTVSGQKATNV